MKTPLLYRIGHACASHPFRALGGFLAALVLVTVLATAFGGATQENWDVPGTESQRGIDLLRDHVPGAGNADARIVLHDDGPLDMRTVDDLRARLAGLDHVATVDAPQFSSDRDTAIIVVGYDVPVTERSLMGNVEPLEKAVQPTRDAGVQVEMNGGLPETAAAPLKGHAEIIGITLALLILVLALGSVVAAGLPILTAIGGLAVGSAAITLLAATMEVSPSAPLVATMVGLGVGIDYALLVVSRHSEFLRAGHDPVESAARAVATAGRSAMFAALTVLISLMGLRLAGLATYSSFGFATAIAVIAMLAATLVVVPAMCRLCGRRMLPRKVRKASAATAPVASTGREPLSARWAAAVGRRPVAFGLLAVIVMVTLAVPALGMRTWPQDSGAQSTELTTRRAHDILVDEYGPGANSQILIVAPTDTVSGAELASATARITSIPGVAAVSAPAISPDGELAVISVTSAYDPAADGTPEMLAAVRSALPQGAILTGATTYFSDISDKLQERLWVVIGFVVAASVLALMVLFRSIAVPIKAALMNLLSVVAAYGVITAVFQWGWGMQLFGLDHTVAVSSWVPILIFAILFGLSMDYEVFLLSRIREDWLATGDAKGSVVRGLARTGRVITSAAAIMVAVFLSFATEADVVLKMLGLGMATAVLLDATLIRMVLVPATMTLLGRFNWWLPGWLDRILPNVDVEGHGHPTPSVEQQTVRPTATEDPDGELQPV